MKNLLTIVLPNGVVLGVTTFADIEAYLKVALLAVTLVYTLWRWRRDVRRDDRRDYARDQKSDASQ